MPPAFEVRVSAASPLERKKSAERTLGELQHPTGGPYEDDLLVGFIQEDHPFAPAVETDLQQALRYPLVAESSD